MKELNADSLASNQHTLFAPIRPAPTQKSKQSQQLYNMLEISDKANPSGILECEGVRTDVFGFMMNVITQNNHPYIREQLIDIANIAIHALPQKGQKLMLDILKEAGPGVSYAKMYTNGTLHEMLRCFAAELLYFQSQIKLLPEDRRQLYDERAVTLCKILEDTISDCKPLLHVQKEHPQVAILKLSMLDSMYITRYFISLEKQIIAQQNNATPPETTHAIGSPQEILARPNYPLAADHASDLALLLLESPNTQNKAELRKLIDAYSRPRYHKPMNIRASLFQLTKDFNTEFTGFSDEIENSTLENKVEYFDRVIVFLDIIEGLAKKYPSILHSNSCSSEVIDAKIEAINAFYNIRELRLDLHNMMTNTQKQKRTAPPSRPKAIHDNGTPPSTNTSSDESHSPTRSSSPAGLTTYGLENKRKCTIM